MSSTSLEVALLLHGSPVQVEVYPRGAVWLGEVAGTDIFLPSELTGVRRHRLMRRSRIGWQLIPLPSAGEPRPITLQRGETYRMALGDWTIRARIVALPPRPEGRAVDALLSSSAQLNALSLLFHLACLSLFVWMQPERAPQILATAPAPTYQAEVTDNRGAYDGPSDEASPALTPVAPPQVGDATSEPADQPIPTFPQRQPTLIRVHEQVGGGRGTVNPSRATDHSSWLAGVDPVPVKVQTGTRLPGLRLLPGAGETAPRALWDVGDDRAITWGAVVPATPFDPLEERSAPGLPRLPNVQAPTAMLIFPGGLTRSVVRRYIQRQRPALVDCYRDLLKRVPSATGEVVISFQIQPDGGVLGARVSASEFPFPTAQACMRRAIQRWRFPSPADGIPARVRRYPLRLRLR